MDKTFVCKRLRMCKYLMKQGFVAYGTQPDKSNPEFINWLFEATPELASALNRWFNEDCYSARMQRRIYAEEEISN